MTPEQLDALRKADDELKIATKKLEAEELEQTEWVQGTLQGQTQSPSQGSRVPNFFLPDLARSLFAFLWKIH